MKGIDIVYHADNNTMELKDAPDDLLIGTDGDDYATYLRFQIIDDEGILDGFSPYVLFEVESRPMIGLDESYTLTLTQELLNKARYGKLPFMLVFKGKESTIEIRSVNTLSLGIAHSIDADREVKDDTYHSELAIKYVEITYHAESRLMELTDMPSDQFVGTDGDDYATYLRFTMDDPNGLLVGYGARVEFDVSIKDDNGDVYKPFIIIDETMSVPLIQRILSNVKYGAIPIQLAFKGTDSEGRSSQYYSLNKLRLSISDSIRALEGVDVNDRIDFNSAINDVEYNTKTATFSFRQIDGGTIAVQLSDLSEEHFEVSTKDDLKKLNKAQNGDTATTLDDGKWYTLYGEYSDPQSWKVMSPSVKAVDDHISDRDNPHNVTKSQIGLGNVDDTSDIDKPISTATQNALDTKADAQELSELSKIVSEEIADRESSEGSINESISNHVSDTNNPHNVTKEQLGLENVDNTSDADKPISTATQSAIDGKVSKSGDKMTGLLELDSLQFTSPYGSWRFRPSGTGYPNLSIYANNDASKPFIQMSLSSNELRLGGDNNRVISNYQIPSNDNSKTIPTTAWINSADIICRTVGNQTIGGTKTFTGYFILSNKSAMNQSLLIKHDYNLSDKTATGKTIGAIVVECADSDTNLFYNDYFVTTEYHRSRMASRFVDNLGVANGTHYIELYANSDGTGYAKAPTTPSDATSNEIATANWVNDKFSALPKVYRPCGSVATFDQLPTNASIGDVYNVESDNQNYAWVEINGVQKWDSLGATIDLTQYYTKTDVDGKLSEVRTIADGKVSKSGDEMTGNLVIRKNLANYALRDGTYEIGDTIPSSISGYNIGAFSVQSKSNVYLGGVIMRWYPNGDRRTNLEIRNASGNTTQLNLYSSSTGDYATAPSWGIKTVNNVITGTDDNSDKIITMKMLNVHPTVVHTIGAEEINGQKSFITPIIDPQNQSGRVSAPNSNASATPYYKIASISIDNINAWDVATLTLDAEYGWSSTEHHSVTYRAIVRLGSNKVVEKVSLAKIWSSGQAHAAFLQKDHWFIGYNETQKVIEIWVKLEYDQGNLNYRVRMSGRRHENFAKWTIHTGFTGTGAASLPSTDDGWIMAQAIDISNRMTYSTPSNATGQEIATADWSIGKFVSKSGDTITGGLGVQGIVRMVNGNLGAMARVGGDASGGKWYKVASLKPIGSQYTDVHMVLAHYDTYAYGNNPTQRVGILNVHVRRSVETVSGELRFMTAGPNVDVSRYALVTYPDFSAELYVQQQNSYSFPNFVRLDANTSNNFVWTLYRENYSVDSLDTLGGTITYASKPVILPPEFASENSNAPATCAWVNTASSIVHTAGAETIGGPKTFTAEPVIAFDGCKLVLKNVEYNMGASLSSYYTHNIAFVDKNNVYGGAIQKRVDSNGDSYITIETQNNAKTATGTIRIYAKNDKSTYVTAPSVKKYVQDAETGEWKWVLDLDDNSNKIATTEWSTGKFVKKSGDTIPGSLVLTRNGWNTLYFRQTNLDVTNVASGTDNRPHYIRTEDMNQKAIHEDVGFVFTTSTYRALTSNFYNADGSKVSSWLNIKATPSNGAYLETPSWSVGTNDNSDKVLTIKMANSLPSLCHSSGNETWSGDKTFSSRVYLNNSLRIKPTASSTRRAVVFNNVADSTEMGWIGYLTDTDNMLINLISGDYVSINKSTPSNATGKEIVTANWVNDKLNNKIVASTTDIGEGSALATGTLYVVYE